MRGNETLMGTEARNIDVQFRIPMRGNENIYTADHAEREAPFRIPMRGNEQAPMTETTAGPRVPNPHEG